MPKTTLRTSRNKPVPMLAALLGMLVLATSCVPAGSGVQSVSAATLMLDLPVSGVGGPALPMTEPLALRPLAPEAAMAMNAAIPVSSTADPAARAFAARTQSLDDRMRSIHCLTTAIYYEAASESEDGQRAVAQVVLNRVRHPAYPNSVCGVVYQGSERTSGCQFSFTCDGSLARAPSAAGWARARRIAEAALAGSVFAPVGHATHYHTTKVLPYWAPSLVKSAVIGAHIFYRWSGRWGMPAAFRQPYAGIEPLSRPKPRLFLAAPALRADLSAFARTAPEQVRLAAAPIDPPGTNLPKVTYEGPGLPQSEVREEYRLSGMPRDQLPQETR